MKLALGIVLVAILLPVYAAEPYTPDTLFFTVYGDGSTVVEYTLTADSNLPRITVPLFGQLYTDMIITNGNNTLLDYVVTDGATSIDTLGAEKVNILYTALDLVNKEGAIWTLNIKAPIIFSVKFPPEATIIGISSVPNAITSIDDQYILTLNSGQQSVSYSTGVVGTKEQASISIKNAEIAIEQAKSEGVSIQEAEEEINKAQKAYDEGRYIDAEQAASKALNLLDQVLTLTTETQTLPPIGLFWIPWIIALAATIALIIVLLRRRRVPKITYEKEIRNINIAKIIQSKPHLRLEDREAIQYLADSGGEAFETELREYFKLPKTTSWRMVRRLQREDLIEVRKVGGQNLIRIKGD